MQRSCSQGQGVTLLLQHGNHLGRKGGEGRQRTQKAGDEQQAPDRVNLRHRLKRCHTHADQVTAQQVGGQRAPGQQVTGA